MEAAKKIILVKSAFVSRGSSNDRETGKPRSVEPSAATTLGPEIFQLEDGTGERESLIRKIDGQGLLIMAIRNV